MRYIKGFVVKVLTTIIGFVNSVLYFIGWIFYLPGLACAWLSGNEFLRMGVLAKLQEPVNGTKIWLASIRNLWTDW